MLNKAAFASKHQLLILSTEGWTEPSLEKQISLSNIWSQMLIWAHCISPKNNNNKKNTSLQLKQFYFRATNKLNVFTDNISLKAIHLTLLGFFVLE